jgi:hypothetical protein
MTEFQKALWEYHKEQEEKEEFAQEMKLINALDLLAEEDEIAMQKEEELKIQSYGI